MTTTPFGRGPREKDPLLAQVSRLPQDVAPSRELWPGIAARLPEPGRAPVRSLSWPIAFAAVFLVAAISALLTWGLIREPAPVASESMLAGRAPAQAVPLPVRYGLNSALGEAQLAARDELLIPFRQRLADLSPETRRTVVANLAVIQRAANEIDAALAQDPASGLLHGLLLGAYQQELQLYSRVVAAGDAHARRT